jgi:hypothetical protein
MRPQLDTIQQLDAFLLRRLNDEDRLLMQARLLLSPELEAHCRQLEATHKLVRLFAREQQRAELNSVYEHLMRKPSFRQKILAIFK